MQDFFPKTLHRLYIFEEGSVLYAADLQKARVVELSAVMAAILELAETRSDAEIRQVLRDTYTDTDISEAFERFAALAREGLLFNRGEPIPEMRVSENERRRLLFAIPSIPMDSFSDIETLYAGTNMALSYMVEHLLKYVDIHFAGNRHRKITDGIYEVDVSVRDFGRLSQRLGETYYGILTLHRETEAWLYPLYRHEALPPILLQCHAPRGHGGKAMNSIFRHYSAMRDCDAFTAPSDYVREFYADYVWDPSVFNTLANGVDSTLFCPMDKSAAKQGLAEALGDARLIDTPTVGYLSRVQSEKGASVYLKLAELNPHLLFLIAGPDLGRYASRALPENLIYVGFHPRQKLPEIYNAFDVYCFLSMSGEETFGLTVLEAMACGVPPVVPNFDGVPSVVGDAGLIADAENFAQDIATLVSYSCPIDFSEKLNRLFNDPELRATLSAKARERALTFTWDKTARRILEIFEGLHRKKRLMDANTLLNAFVPVPPAMPDSAGDAALQYKSIILGMNRYYERALIGDLTYSQRVEDGLALTLLKNHTLREAESILSALIEDETAARMILKRICGLIHATT